MPFHPLLLQLLRAPRPGRLGSPPLLEAPRPSPSGIRLCSCPSFRFPPAIGPVPSTYTHLGFAFSTIGTSGAASSPPMSVPARPPPAFATPSPAHSLHSPHLILFWVMGSSLMPHLLPQSFLNRRRVCQVRSHFGPNNLTTHPHVRPDVVTFLRVRSDTASKSCPQGWSSNPCACHSRCGPTGHGDGS